MKRFAFSLAIVVVATTAAFADTLPDQVRSEASHLLKRVDAAKVAANSRSALKPKPLEPALIGDLQRFAMTSSQLSLEIDRTGGPTDLRCIFRGMAEETDNQLKAADAAETGAQQAVALDRLTHMLKDAVEIAPAVGGSSAQTKTATSAKPAAAKPCPVVKKS